MISDQEQLKELQLEAERLRWDLGRYRTATEDSLQQIAWCVGYFAGTNKRHVARTLDANAAYIRHSLLDRKPVTLPPSPKG